MYHYKGSTVKNEKVESYIEAFNKLY